MDLGLGLCLDLRHDPDSHPLHKVSPVNLIIHQDGHLLIVIPIEVDHLRFKVAAVHLPSTHLFTGDQHQDQHRVALPYREDLLAIKRKERPLETTPEDQSLAKCLEESHPSN